MPSMSKKNLAIAVILLILLVDQILKIWIKTHFYLGEETRVFGNWFLLHFIENRGMAFGLEFAGKFGKVLLTLFRIGAATFIFWYLLKLIKKGIPNGLVICVALIIAGAFGNVIDSAFYGLIFTDSVGHVAQIFPAGGGYAPFLHGSVVDMLFFPIIKGSWPLWSPINAGQPFLFFSPVFNIADASISVGICAILIFYRKYFVEEKRNPEVEKAG
jgi:signal peptidase II